MTPIPMLKVTFDGKKVRLYGWGTAKWQMFRLAQIGRQSILDRTAKGIGSDDASMPQLAGQTKRVTRQGRTVAVSSGYKGFKLKRGLRPFRDLRGAGVGGHMLEAFRVVSASESRAVLDITTRLGRIKARANEQRAPWFGWSPNDLRTINAAAAEIFKTQTAGVVAQFRGTRGTFSSSALPVWMNPLGFQQRKVA